MKSELTELEGVIILEPRVFGDERGAFFESFNQEQFDQITGKKTHFVQDNQSISQKGVLRGLHFQNPPFAQGKLVRVVKGAVIDVAVDLRKDSPTYGKHVSVELSEKNHRQLWIPPGFAHGFVALEDDTIFAYKCTDYYAPQSEGCIKWDDQSLAIQWGIKTPIVSEKDQQGDEFHTFVSAFQFFHVTLKLIQLLCFGLGGVLTAIVTNVLLLHFARSLGIRNKNDIVVRWSSESKPSLGGVSFFVVFIFASIAYSIVFNEVNIFQNKKYVGLLLAGSISFVMGLADDAYNTKPLIKLFVQILCGFIFVWLGSYIQVFDSFIPNMILTVLWVVIVMNSLNMLDNMDGITGTTVFFILTSCLFAGWIIFDINTNIWTLLLIAVIGATLGFLTMNVHPSKLFMGDAGSQFIGCFVAYFGIEYLWNSGVHLKQSPILGVFVVLVAFTPAAVDTLTVVINRLRRGQSPMVGGKDHTTHHLVYAGLTDRKVWYVFVLIGLFATILSVFMIDLMKLDVVAPLVFFILYTVFVFVLLYRNTLKYPAPKKQKFIRSSQLRRMINIFSKSIFLAGLIFCFISCDSSINQTDSKEIPVISSKSRTGHIIPSIPEKMTFCGIEIPLDNFDIRERLDRELIINAHFHSSTIQILKKSGRFFPEIERILKEENVPEDLKYVCVIESALSQATSPTGAKGFWQFMPETGKEFGLEITDEVDERLDVEKSTRAACDYLKRAQKKFDDWILTSASYNCGMNGLSRVIEEQGQADFFQLYLNQETSRYIFRILALKIILENPASVGFEITPEEKYQPVAVKELKVNEEIQSLSAWANKQGTNLQMLKVLNPWLVGSSLTPKNKTFTLKIPQ